MLLFKMELSWKSITERSLGNSQACGNWPIFWSKQWIKEEITGEIKTSLRWMKMKIQHTENWDAA